MTAQAENIQIVGRTKDGKPIQSNQADLVRRYKQEYEQNRPRNIKELLKLQAKWKAKGLVF